MVAYNGGVQWWRTMVAYNGGVQWWFTMGYGGIHYNGSYAVVFLTVSCGLQLIKLYSCSLYNTHTHTHANTHREGEREIYVNTTVCFESVVLVKLQL